MTDVFVNGKKYRIVRRIYTDGFWTPDDFKSCNSFYESAKDTFGFAILANYGKYWGVGENYYDATESLYAQMFMANRYKFIKIIDSEKKQKRK